MCLHEKTEILYPQTLNAFSNIKKERNIRMKVELITYEQAKKDALKTVNIKGHEIFILDIPDFGYSALVFKEQTHLKHANEYELYYQYKVKAEGREALLQYFLEQLNEKLFTEDEIFGSANSYFEYKNKLNYVLNIWIAQFEHISAFYIGKTEEKELKKKIKKYPHYSPYSFCYVKNKEIIRKQTLMMRHLNDEFIKLRKNPVSFREMISYELANYEACITYRTKDAFEALGLTDAMITDEMRTIANEEFRKQIHEYLEEVI